VITYFQEGTIGSREIGRAADQFGTVISHSIEHIPRIVAGRRDLTTLLYHDEV